MKRRLIILACACLVLTAGTVTGQQLRPLGELIDPFEAGWKMIMQWSAAATNKIQVLPKDNLKADDALYESQLSTATPIGAMIYGCGGILVDHGWIRILGSGHPLIDRSLPEWNKGKAFKEFGEEPSMLLIADDALGGFFAINAGGIEPEGMGDVYYYGPNKLKWESIGLNYSNFIVFCFSGNIEKFYQGFRWKGWENEVSKMSGNDVITCYPLLWTNGSISYANSHKVVTVEKQWALYHDQKFAVAHKKPVKKKSTKKKPIKKK